jgi:ABC-2 type transport system permease protein
MSKALNMISANLKNLLRDKMSVFWFIGFPLIFVIIFGTLFGGFEDGETKFDIGLVVEDDGPMGQVITQVFKSVPVFELSTGDREGELQALRKSERMAVVIVPESDSGPAAGDPIAVELRYDPSKMSTTGTVTSVIGEVLYEIENRMRGQERLIRVEYVAETGTEGGEELNSVDFIIPGILAMALMQLGLFGTFTFVSMREKKVIKRIGATPIPRTMVLWSEVIVRVIISLFQATIIIVVGRLLFGVSVQGNWFLLFFLVILGALTFVSLGYLLVSFSRTEESAQGIIQMVQFPMMFLSGIFFPTSIMPDFLVPVMKVLPLTYLGDAIRHVMLGWDSAFGFSNDIYILLGWLVVSLVLAVKRFRWE